MADRRPKNPAEGDFWDHMIQSGWEITKKGAPDFFCWKGERFCCVEVKAYRGRKLKREQRKVLRALSKRGIECYRWDPDEGFIKISGNIHIL